MHKKAIKFTAILITAFTALALLSPQNAKADTIKISVSPSESMYDYTYGENVKWVNGKDNSKKRYAKFSVKHNASLKKEIEEQEMKNKNEKKKSIETTLKIAYFFSSLLICSLLMLMIVSFLIPIDFLKVKNH